MPGFGFSHDVTPARSDRTVDREGNGQHQRKLSSIVAVLDQCLKTIPQFLLKDVGIACNCAGCSQPASDEPHSDSTEWVNLPTCACEHCLPAWSNGDHVPTYTAPRVRETFVPSRSQYPSRVHAWIDRALTLLIARLTRRTWRDRLAD